MLKKMLLSIAIIGISFLTGYATAQSYFINKTPGTPANGDSPSQTVLSPSDFQSQTQQLEEKKRQAMSDQLKQELAKVPPTPPPTTPSSETTAPEAGQTAAPEANPTEGHAAKPPTATTTPSAAMPANTAPMQEAAPSGPLPATPPVSAPPQSRVYTGFQNSNQDQTQSSPSTDNKTQPPASGGGWNIKY